MITTIARPARINAVYPTLVKKNQPGMDGDEGCRIIRADPGLAMLPVIMVTGFAGHDDLAISL